MATSDLTRSQTSPSATMSADAFDEWALLPENRDRRLEYLNGRIIELVSNDIASGVAFKIAGFLFMYLVQNDIGIAKGPDGGYIVDGHRFMPDVGFMRYERRTVEGPVAYYPAAPDLAVEVISNPDSREEQTDLRLKLRHYLRAGTVVWIVDWKARRIEVHIPDQPPQVVGEDGTVNGGDVLPDFTLTVKDVFPAVDASTDAPQSPDATSTPAE